MAPVQVTERVLRRLIESAPRSKVVSLYIDLDPSRFATPDARDAQLNSLLTDARDQVRRLDLSHDDTEGLNHAIDHVADDLEDWPVDGADALAVFAAAPDWHQVIPLARHVEPLATVTDGPLLEPLTEHIVRETWGVLMIDRRHVRFLRGVPGHLAEMEEFDDILHRQHKAGGWSQANFQRSVEQDVANHLKRSAAFVHDELKRGLFDRLLVVTKQEMRNDVLEALPSEVLERVETVVEMDIEHTPIPEIEERLEEVITERDMQQEQEAIDRLREQLGRHGRATQGTAGVVRALNERRVAMLLIEPDAEPHGAICPQCGFLDHQARDCPVDGTPLERRDDLIDRIIEVALEQAATVHALTQRALGVKDGIAALTRF